jgi:tetratricopeptide (TPR) repeat protein
MLSSTLEMIRIISALPLCVFLTVLGWRKVALSFAPGRQIFAFVLLMIFSVSLDSYHLWGPCHQWAVPDKYTQGSKSPEHYQAFQILKKLNQESGFGLVFSDFYYDVFDQSLFVATYGFNAAANPGLLPSQAKWAAVIMAPWDVDTFKKRFPSAVFYDLSGKLAQDDQNKIWMAVVDLSGEREKALIGWVQIHKKTQDLFAVYPYHVPNASYQKILESLWKINAQAPAEPFIKNCLMEKIIDAAFQSSVISGAEPLAQIPSQALWHPSIFKQRCAVAFHRLGMWYFKQGRLSDARRLFLRAAELDPEYPLKKALALLNKN